jgi:peptide/nickel transport system ATP-binding protein
MTDVRQPLLKVQDLTVTFGHHHHAVSAVAGVSFEIYEGETLGLVGESGCGKSTTGKALMRIVEPSSGTIELEGMDITKQTGRALRNARTHMQMIFQDPISSLNPRRRVKDIVAEPLDCWKKVQGPERDALISDLLSKVGIDPAVYGNRYARQFSGGQCQRISIARSLAMRPKLLICDEMVSALDVSVQAQILNLLEDLKAEYGLTLLFIAHDLAVVKNVSDRVAVMYLGKICEIGPADALSGPPLHEVPAGCGARGRPRLANSQSSARRRAAQPDEPAERVSLPHTLSQRHRQVRRRRAPAPGGRSGAPGGLSLPPVRYPQIDHCPCGHAAPESRGADWRTQKARSQPQGVGNGPVA